MLICEGEEWFGSCVGFGVKLACGFKQVFDLFTCMSITDFERKVWILHDHALCDLFFMYMISTTLWILRVSVVSGF